jgi:hypothetical protein
MFGDGKAKILADLDGPNRFQIDDVIYMQKDFLTIGCQNKTIALFWTPADQDALLHRSTSKPDTHHDAAAFLRGSGNSLVNAQLFCTPMATLKTKIAFYRPISFCVR